MPSWPPPTRSAGSGCARSSVHAFAYLRLRNRPGHQSWARRRNRPATPPGALCADSPGSASRLRAGRKERGCNLGSSRAPAAGWAAGERPSGFAAGAAATPPPGTAEDSGGGGVGVGGGIRAASTWGLRQGPSHPHSPRPESRREGEGALVPLQVGMETALPPPPRACISALWVLVPQRAPPRWEASVPWRRKNKRGLWKPGFTSS